MRVLAIVLAVFSVTACTLSGPSAVTASRSAYKLALQQTEDEQLLLNLVRLRFRDRPLFLEATALNTQFIIDKRGSATGEFGPDPSPPLVLGGTVAYSERPTVTYRPLQGDALVTRMLTPISLDTLVLLRGSGWSTERVLRTCVERMNGLDNAPRADGPTPKTAPDFEDFLGAAATLRELEVAGHLGGAQTGEKTSALRVRPEGQGTECYQRLLQALDLDTEGRGVFELVSTTARTDRKTINLRTRSFLGVMYFLSQSVEVTPEDEAKGLVTVTRDATGERFEWARVTEGIFRIRTSLNAPTSAAVRVFYRGRWYFIDDADLGSKSTFSMLGQLQDLQAGSATGVAPVLTLPVGG